MLIHRRQIKLRATNSSISRGVINKVHSIYVSIPFPDSGSLTDVDLALGVLFHRFQVIFDRIRLTFSVAIRSIKINKCNYSVSTSQNLGDCVREHVN